MGITEIAERVCDCIMLGDYEYGSPRAQQSGICFMKIKCYFSYCTDFIHNDVWENDIHIFLQKILIHHYNGNHEFITSGQMNKNT